MSDQSAANADFAADFLRGAAEIAAFLQTLGFDDATEQRVYYWNLSKRFSFGKFGNELVASKAKLTREARKLIA